jgi:hypothetical protein
MNPSELLVPAVHEVAAAAELAVTAGAAEKPDTHALTDRPALNTRAKSIEPADDLVPGDARPLNRKQSVYSPCVGVANAARLYADSDVSGRRIDHWLRSELPLAGADNLYRTVGAFP